MIDTFYYNLNSFRLKLERLTGNTNGPGYILNDKQVCSYFWPPFTMQECTVWDFILKCLIDIAIIIVAITAVVLLVKFFMAYNTFATARKVKRIYKQIGR